MGKKALSEARVSRAACGETLRYENRSPRSSEPCQRTLSLIAAQTIDTSKDYYHDSSHLLHSAAEVWADREAQEVFS